MTTETARPPAEDEAVLDAHEAVEGDHTDIYQVLGLRPDASALLAREMYWSRIQPLLDPERRDDPDARATIESLNRALAIISDQRLRTDYDLRHGVAPSRAPVAPPAALRVLRGLWRLLLVSGLASAIGLLGSQWSWTAAGVGTGILGAVSLALWVGSAVTRPRPTPFERLGVGDDASRRDLDVAYQARAQELLIRLGHDPRAAAELNALDRHYIDAMRFLIAPDLAPKKRAPAWLEPLGEYVAALAARAAGSARETAWRLTRAASGRARRMGADALKRASRPAPPRAERAAPTQETHQAPAAVATTPTEAPTERRGLLRREIPESPQVDLERRLAASLKANTLEIAVASAPPPVEADAPPAARTAAYLLLYASAGVRRVPIAERPIRIGSANDCDLVLPERSGVAPEHALLWRRGDAVVLHVTDPAGKCSVNGRNSTWATLEHGDELRLGEIELHIEVELPAQQSSE